MLMRLRISFHRILWKYLNTTIEKHHSYNDHWCCSLRKLFWPGIRPHFSLSTFRSSPVLSFSFVRFSKALFSKFKSAYDMFWSFCVANLENFSTQNDNNHLHMNYMCSLYFVLVWYVVIWKYINKISDKT